MRLTLVDVNDSSISFDSSIEDISGIWRVAIEHKANPFDDAELSAKGENFLKVDDIFSTMREYLAFRYARTQ